MTFGAALLQSCNPCSDEGSFDYRVKNFTPVAKIITEVSPGEIDFYRTAKLSGTSPVKYDSLSLMLYLYEYIGKAPVDGGISFTNQAYACDPPVYADYLESLSITSDTDYDAAHPAGSDLNDIFLFNTREYSNMKTHTEFFSRSRELTTSFLFLRFNTAPATTSTHTFSITLNLRDGETFSGEITGLTISP